MIVGSIETLKRRLLEEDHISCAYQLRNGYWREADFWRMELSAGEVSKVIYYSQDLDTAMAKRMEERQEMTEVELYLLLKILQTLSNGQMVYRIWK